MILVTGATGLVGAHLCYLLTTNKQTLVGVYRREKKRKATEQFFISKGGLEGKKRFDSIIWRKADLTNLPELSLVFEGITQVYHCAAYISMAFHKRRYLTQVNQQGTADLVNLCIQNKIKKLAYVSSIAALGDEEINLEVNENSPWNSSLEKTPYAYSKYGAEMEVWRASQEGVEVVIVNPGVILGLGMPRSPLALLLEQIKKGVYFYPTGKTGYVAVEDVCEVLKKLMESNIVNERFILVGENWTYREMMHKIAIGMGKKTPNWILRKSYLYILWAIESFFDLLQLRKKFLSKALIESLANKSEINGNKIKSYLPFKYRKIEDYLVSLGL